MKGRMELNPFPMSPIERSITASLNAIAESIQALHGVEVDRCRGCTCSRALCDRYIRRGKVCCPDCSHRKAAR